MSGFRESAHTVFFSLTQRFRETFPVNSKRSLRSTAAATPSLDSPGSASVRLKTKVHAMLQIVVLSEDYCEQSVRSDALRNIGILLLRAVSCGLGFFWQH